MTMHVLRIPAHALGDFSHNDKVVITGSFDNWEHTKHVLNYNDSDKNYTVSIPDAGSGLITFKFVINDREWVTLSYFETETDSRGLVNNVLRLQDHNDECLDDITISSVIHTDPVPGSKSVPPTSRDPQPCQNSSAKLSDKSTEADPVPTNSSTFNAVSSKTTSSSSRAPHAPPVEHDYIHVSSQDELSSTENLDLTGHESCESQEHVGQAEPADGEYDSQELEEQTTPASQKRLRSLVSVVKRVKMYWSG
ncbi:LADA_0H08174g1_1 [Lachancea dasiensis]|uniref:LADA_0H08174g1_1 n=1 Tax=Lachancea dasiensis TaxID=1072105 RepID=A0A1G4K2C5_9SACH|nr:LADA_0H08174g1_1 [Lachancea dasiensis]